MPRRPIVPGHPPELPLGRPGADYTLHLVVIKNFFTKCWCVGGHVRCKGRAIRELKVEEKVGRDTRACLGDQLIHRLSAGGPWIDLQTCSKWRANAHLGE